MAVYGEKICEQCGESYEAIVGWQRFCSDECTKQWGRQHPDEHKGKAKAKVCEQCGEWFQPKKQVGKRQRFCSEECQRQWWSENREENGKVYHFICQNCGKEYETRYSDRDTCCSRECGFEWLSKRALVEKQCVSCGRPFQGLKSRSDFCCDECRDRGMRRVCVVCGDMFYGHGRASYCSDECERQLRREQWRKAKEEIGKNSGRVEQLICKECGKGFIHRVHNKVPVFCSSSCASAFFRKTPKGKACKRRYRHIRRAREHGIGPVESIDPLDVFERDSWRCGICGKKVNPRLTFPHPMSPTLDHILPLAQGGTHTWGNVHLAHFICNSRKSDVGGGQLRLGIAHDIH